MNFHSLAGFSLSIAENGTIWSAFSLPSRKITTRCRLLPLLFDVHS